MIFALIPSDRANSQLVVSWRSWSVPPRSPLSLCLRLRSRELPFRTFYFLNNAATERETVRRAGGEGKTSGRDPVGHSRANHAGHTLRVGRYVAAAGTGSSINLDHGVISPPLLGIRTTRRTPARGPPSTVNARIIYGERDASMLLIYAILIRRDYRILGVFDLHLYYLRFF